MPNVVRRRPIRSAISLFRKFAVVCALVIGLAQATLAQTEDSVELTLDQARSYAVYALREGDPGLAIQLSKGLLKANPKDPVAHYVIATAHARMQQPHAGRVAAAKAYRFADPGEDKFRAAQLAARLSFEEKRHSLTQLWLRRSAIHAQTDEQLEQVGKDYKVLRQVNPWSFRLRTDIRPSNNVNNGSDTALNIIDGTPDGGSTPPSARALSGIIGSLDLITAYRLQASKTSATTLIGRLYVQRVALSNAAKEKAPRATGSDFASTYGALSINHAFAVGPSGAGGSAAFNLTFGESWARKDRYYRFGRLRAERGWIFSGQRRLKLFASGEQRYKAVFSSNDARILEIGTEVGKVLKNNDTLAVTMILRDSIAKTPNGTFSSAALLGTYSFARPIGPARLSLGLVLGYSHYDSYLTSLFLGPRERTDKSAYTDATLTFHEYDYAGFVPTLRFRVGKKRSNFSRFESRELSLSLGIASKF